ncbi:MAG: hypothetical protein K2W95_15305 [Candidatus Obscuribacterales bacterium]|nr:hypothetical protein [Candidatus Obscuribacterales bacterium]
MSSSTMAGGDGGTTATGAVVGATVADPFAVLFGTVGDVTAAGVTLRSSAGAVRTCRVTVPGVVRQQPEPGTVPLRMAAAMAAGPPAGGVQHPDG